jgi:hypothetical protein
MSGSGAGGRHRLAANDLRHPLVAHAEHVGNGRHRQAIAVRPADGLVTLGAQLLGLALQLGFALAVVLGKRLQAGLGFRDMTLRTGDPGIVCTILAS